MQAAALIIDATSETSFICPRYFSERTGCDVYDQAEEFINPTGAGKDRAAQYIILKIEECGQLQAVHIANSRGYRTIITPPETQSRKKIDLLCILGTQVSTVPDVFYRDVLSDGTPELILHG